MSENNGCNEQPLHAEEISRRKFLGRISWAAGLVGATLVGIPFVGFIFSPLIKKSPSAWRDVGPVDQFKVGTTKVVSYTDPSPLPWAGVTAQSAAWVRRNSDTEFVAFSVNCTHLGCPVRWLPDAELFLCPCHGGVYNKDGQVVAGPPPKALFHYPVRVQNGQVQVLTSPIPLG